MSCYSLILASGTGTRLPNDENLPKQFLPIFNESILLVTLKQFLKNDSFEKHIIVVQEAWYAYTLKIVEPYVKEYHSIYITIGDQDRQGSLLNGLTFINEQFGCKKEDIVVTHDAVRPFVSQEVINSNIRLLEEDPTLEGVDTVIPSTDTMLYSKDGVNIEGVPNRDHLFRGQTPQSFRLSVIIKVMSALSLDERYQLTDAITALVLAKKRVGMVIGSVVNMKVTTPEELLLARTLHAHLIERLDGTYYL